MTEAGLVRVEGGTGPYLWIVLGIVSVLILVVLDVILYTRIPIEALVTLLGAEVEGAVAVGILVEVWLHYLESVDKRNERIVKMQRPAEPAAKAIEPATPPVESVPKPPDSPAEEPRS